MNSEHESSAPSLSAEAYLRVIHLLEQKEGRTSVGAITREIGFAQASVSAMIARLAMQGWVAHEPYDWVVLTEQGRRVAARMAESQRVIERYLIEVLALPTTSAKVEAQRLRRAASDELIDRMRFRIDGEEREEEAAEP